MRVGLIAEGCYPYVTGGVSTWCDQLIRGLPQINFEVIAVTATSRVRPAMQIPSNVSIVRCVPLWDWAVQHRKAPRDARERFLAIYRELLSVMLQTARPQGDFDQALREMFEFAQNNDLTVMFNVDEAVDAVMSEWFKAVPNVPITVRDALETTELMEHMLLPLATAIPRVDVCHPVSNGLPALIALAARWRYGTPIVMSEHGVYLRERYLGFRRLHYGWPVKSVMLAFLRRVCTSAYQQADVIAPVNVFNRRWEVSSGADPDRIRTVYNGVDPEIFVPAPVEPVVPTIGWVGRIDPLKDLITLVKAFEIVRSRVPDARLRLFGPTPAGNEAYAESIRRLVAETGTGDAVSFEGPVRPVTSAYHASTVVALSSISEGLPYTVMEAMMCGRATVSTDVGGVAEVAGDGGLVVPPRDPNAMADKLICVLSDNAVRSELGRRARRRALDMFRLQTMLANFQDVYDRLTRSRVVDLTDELEAVTEPSGAGIRLPSSRLALANILLGTRRATS